MKELVEFIIRQLVTDQSQVEISEREEENVVTVSVSVSPSDMGRIIGKQGRIAKAIRTIAKAAAKDKKIYNIDIVDKDKPEQPQE